MGLFDMKADNTLRRMFDRDGDGKLNDSEHSEMWGYMNETGEIDDDTLEEFDLMDDDY